MIKRFLEWIRLKEKLDAGEHKPPLVKERDIWWVLFGENVDSEMNGKSYTFSRPALVFKKISHGFYFVTPHTSQSKVGNWFVAFEYRGKREYACLHQVRVIDHRRLLNKFGAVIQDDFALIRKGFEELYIKNTPRKKRGRG